MLVAGERGAALMCAYVEAARGIGWTACVRASPMDGNTGY
jgi:hypothetical protein